MAPQKTMAISQQQQQQQALHQQTTNGRAASASQGDQQTGKSKKRKGKQQISSGGGSNNATQQPKVAAISDNHSEKNNGKLPELDAGKENLAAKTIVKQPSFDQQQQQHQKAPLPNKCNNERTSTTPANRSPIKPTNQSSPPTSLPVKESPTAAVATEIITNNNSPKKTSPVVVARSATVIAKQISTDDQDDIDAGIELDGSSNSGSSVKDLNEDHQQLKSASVSPVMAASSLETRNNPKHAVEVAPMEQLAGSLCTDIVPGKKQAAGAGVGSGGSPLTKQQLLAANQQVIDADEQLLQQKLQSKQRKSLTGSSTLANGSTTTTTSSNSISLNASSSSNGVAQIGGAASRSSLAGQVAQSPTLCRICEQHVYQMERMMAEKSVYHKSCFRCYQCKIQLRIDNYSSHEGQLYCRAHHRQIFQPQVNLDNEDDVDIVAKSKIRKRQMIICENEPAELPKDVVRSDTKLDDGIERLNLNLGNIKERFERGAAASNSSGEESAPSSAGIVIEKPSFNLKKTLLAFETKSLNSSSATNEDDTSVEKPERPVVRKLTNLNGFLNRQGSNESEPSPTTPTKPLAVRRSESLMMRLKKYESRIAGDQVTNDDDEEDDGGAKNGTSEVNNNNQEAETSVPKKLSSIDLSSLKSQWENGDISKRREVGDQQDTTNGESAIDSAAFEKNEELTRIRQQLARKRSAGSSSSSIKNIYENAIKEAQQSQQRAPPSASSRLSDLSALSGSISTTEIQQQLLQQNGNYSSSSARRQSQQHDESTPSTPNKDHFQLNLSNKANRLRERFEQGLINNNSHDDSDEEREGGEATPREPTKLEQLRQEKLEDLSIFTEGEIRAREARSMFQQIDRRLSNGQNQTLPPNSRSLSSISASMQAKLQSKGSASSLDSNSGSPAAPVNGVTSTSGSDGQQKPIRLMNNVKT